MRRNFKPHESRGFSSIWNPGSSEAQMPSDAPTRPVSSNAPPPPRGGFNALSNASNAYDFGQSIFSRGNEGLNGSNLGYSGGYNASKLANPYRRPLSSTYNAFAAGSSLEDVRVDNSSADMSIIQESFVPPPSLDIPDARIAARYHHQRGKTPGIEAALANRHSPVSLAALSASRQQHVQEIYTALRLAGLSVPSSISKPLFPNDLYAAVSHFFQLISPLPDNYTATAQGAAYLLQLLGYSEERLEVDIFALRMPHRNAAWPVVVDMLWWLFELTQAVPEPVEDWLADKRIQNNMDFESYLEYASASAFPLQLVESGPSLPDEYISEIKLTIQKYTANTAAAVEEEQQALDRKKERFSSLEQEQSGMTGDMKKYEELERENKALQSSISKAAKDAHELREEILYLQTHTDELRRRDAENEGELGLLHQQILDEGLGSVEQFVQLAETHSDLKQRHEELSHDVLSLRTRLTEEFERPARQKLTAIRIALDEYNDGTPTDLTLLESTHLSTNLDEIWGRPMASLLGENSDPNNLKRLWRNLEATERKNLEELEDAVSGLDAEIKSLENRLKFHSSKAEELQTVAQRLEHEKDSTSETLATLQHQQLRRTERMEHCGMLLSALKTSIETLEQQNTRLKEEVKQTEAAIHRAIERKQTFEMMFLEYQNAYGLLEDKIDQLEKANVSLSQAKLDAELWISDLKPRPVVAQPGILAMSSSEITSATPPDLLAAARQNVEQHLQPC